MLLSIEIRHFAIIQSLQLDYHKGMTVITGETGAGKSIVIDALSLTLGERADPSVIMAGRSQAEISSIFAIDPNSEAFDWLTENSLLDDEIEESSSLCECILRRVIAKNGRSKCYINGRSVTQAQLKQLGSYLVDIHGQHAQQSLMKAKEQLNLVDRYANHGDLLSHVKLAYQQLKDLEQKKQRLEQQKASRDAKRELLTYQVEELQAANPQESLLDNLEKEHKNMATAQDRMDLAANLLSDLSQDESQSSLQQLQTAIHQLDQLLRLDPSLFHLKDSLLEAEVLMTETSQEINQYLAELDCDPQALEQLNNQLTQYHDLARKHQISMQDLPQHFAKLQQELGDLQQDDQALESIEQDFQQAVYHYQQQAKLLTESRIATAKKLQQLITQKIQPLAMEGGRVSIQIKAKSDGYYAKGMEDIEFLVAANPGQPLLPLTKVASGGELSRISLAISVITSEQQLVPCIIFDEVDVGIGGATAETVGELLKQLSTNRQVMCVTHQPQVASYGDHHLQARKQKLDQQTSTSVTLLSEQQRIDEIARMLGGKIISDTSKNHALEMLEQAAQ